MIVYGCELMRTDLPMTAASPPKSRSPEPLADHGDVGRARLIFAVREEAAGERCDAKEREPVRADANAEHALGVGAVADEVRGRRLR